MGILDSLLNAYTRPQQQAQQAMQYEQDAPKRTSSAWAQMQEQLNPTQALPPAFKDAGMAPPSMDSDNKLFEKLTMMNKEKKRKANDVGERTKSQIDVMMRSGDPKLQEKALQMMTELSSKNLALRNNWEKSKASGSDKVSFEKYLTFSPEEKDEYDRWGRFNRPSKIQVSEQIMKAYEDGDMEKVIRLTSAFDQNEMLDTGTGYVNANTLFLPEDVQAGIEKHLEAEAARKKTGALRADTVHNFSQNMSNADSMYDDITYTLREINDLAGLTDYDTTGFANWLSFIPLSNAHEWDSAKELVLSRLSLDKIMEMKSQSSTGATGLGALSARELDTLERNLINLKGTRGKVAILDSLEKVYDTLRETQVKIRKAQKDRVKEYESWAPSILEDPSTMMHTDGFKTKKYDPEYLPSMLKKIKNKGEIDPTTGIKIGSIHETKNGKFIYIGGPFGPESFIER